MISPELYLEILVLILLKHSQDISSVVIKTQMNDSYYKDDEKVCLKLIFLVKMMFRGTLLYKGLITMMMTMMRKCSSKSVVVKMM